MATPTSVPPPTQLPPLPSLEPLEHPHQVFLFLPLSSPRRKSPKPINKFIGKSVDEMHEDIISFSSSSHSNCDFEVSLCTTSVHKAVNKYIRAALRRANEEPSCNKCFRKTVRRKRDSQSSSLTGQPGSSPHTSASLDRGERGRPAGGWECMGLLGEWEREGGRRI